MPVVKTAAQLTDSTKWAAVVNGERCYDGVFVYAVRTTGVFCRPSCVSRIPLRENVCYFNTPEEAMYAGFRPCKKCLPCTIDPAVELTSTVKDVFTQKFSESEIVNRLIDMVGVSRNKLMRVFKRYEGCTMGQSLAMIRIDKAKTYLRQTEMPIIDVAFCSGFNSLSNFYQHFKEQTEMTPAQYRRLGRAKQ